MSLDDPFSYEQLLTVLDESWSTKVSKRTRAEQDVFLTMINLNFSPAAAWVGMMKTV